MKQREIKFRAYHTTAKKMLYGETRHVFTWENEGQPVEIMQYTGLKDKNGKDIYEGDIVHISKDGQVWSVEYDETEARFIVYNQLNSNRSFDFDYYQEYPDCPIVEICTANVFYPEVIGNIYENSELLK